MVLGKVPGDAAADDMPAGVEPGVPGGAAPLPTATGAPSPAGEAAVLPGSCTPPSPGVTSDTGGITGIVGDPENTGGPSVCTVTKDCAFLFPGSPQWRTAPHLWSWRG